jgi:class 3 adenylate cyclase/tetratricopeptide (TPR) repeat protein
MLPPESASALRGYLPAAILSRLDAGQTGWLAELRPVTVLFINLAGLNVLTTEALDQTHAVIRSLQSTLYRHEGSLNKLSLDEKGLTLVAALGLPPFAHSDDPARGVQTAIEVQDRLRELDVRGAIGVASGRVYCGEIGGRGRREYTVIGDRVNLAARLMQAAPGTILCDPATRQAARARFAFEALPPVIFKGKSEPIPIFRPSGQAASLGDSSPLIGRIAERRHLHARLESLVVGSGGLVLIEGEAGIGKSRLVADMVGRAEEMSITILSGAGDAVERSTPYFAWRPVVARLLGVEGLDDPDERRARVKDRLGADPDLSRLAPLLNAFLPLDLPDNELTATMAGRVRADNTHALLMRLLGEAARPRPTALVLEDAHWLDSASWALTAQVRRRLPSLLLVLAQRPMSGPRSPDGRALLESPDSERMVLGALEPDDVVALACHRLGVDSLPPPVAALIRQKAHGHPFFSEELAYTLRDLGLIEIDDGACLPAPGVDWDAVPLPESIQGVITSRIDRLPPSHQLTLKISSVIGCLFPLRVLLDIFPIEPERRRLPQLLDDLNGLGFTLEGPSKAEVSYLFKHLTTKEVAYDMLLFAHRRRIHRSIAAWYERTHYANLSAYYPLLAYHWSRAGDERKAIDALERAGEQALRSGAYREAVSFLLEAIVLEDRSRSWRSGPGRTSRRARWEAQLGEAYLGLGRLAESRAHTERALRLLEQPVPATPVRLVGQFAWEFMRQGAHRLWPSRFAGRSHHAVTTIRLASAAYDALAQVCYYSQDVPRGVYSSLRALNLAEEVGPSPELARGRATMCIASGLIPLHRLAESYGRRAWATAVVIDDPATRAFVAEMLGVYWLGIGNWKACREKLLAAAEISRRIGDWRRWEESVGELARLDYLQGHFDRALDQFGELWCVARKNGHDQAQVWGRHGRSMALLRMGRFEEAASLLEESPAIDADFVAAADKILGLGLLAVARLRLGMRPAARKAAQEALRQIEPTRPMASFNLEGYSGAVEVFLALWDASRHESSGRSRDLEQLAHRACRALRTFARVFPIAGPRVRLWRGLILRLSGHSSRADAVWSEGLERAGSLDMPYEQALLHLEIGRHAEVGGAARPVHLGCAGEILTRLGAADELARLVAIKEARPEDSPFRTLCTAKLQEGINHADTIEGAREIVRGQPPGRYDVDEIRAAPFPSGHTSRS